MYFLRKWTATSLKRLAVSDLEHEYTEIASEARRSIYCLRASLDCHATFVARKCGCGDRGRCSIRNCERSKAIHLLVVSKWTATHLRCSRIRIFGLEYLEIANKVKQSIYCLRILQMRSLLKKILYVLEFRWIFTMRSIADNGVSFNDIR